MIGRVRRINKTLSPSSGEDSSPLYVVLDTLVVVAGAISILITLLAIVNPNMLPRSEVDESVFAGAVGAAASEHTSDVKKKDGKDASPLQEEKAPTSHDAPFDGDSTYMYARSKTAAAAFIDGSLGKKTLHRALVGRLKKNSEKRTRKLASLTDARVLRGDLAADDAAKVNPKDEKQLDQEEGRGALKLVGDSPDARGLLAFGDREERDVFEQYASMFVSMAQYRDVLCPLTIQQIYTKARNPRRIFAGIVDQRLKQTNASWTDTGFPRGIKHPVNFKNAFAADQTCVPWYMQKTCATSEFCPTDNIRVRHDWPSNARGPTWGRYLGGLLYQGEQYFVMIDSHSMFSHHWDMQIVFNLLMVPKKTKKPVLSHYPSPFQAPDQLVGHRFEMSAMMMCYAKYLSFGIIRMNSVGFRQPGYPAMQQFSAGGFVAGDASFVHDVPFDPYLYYVFDGEEVLYAARLWTHGYDLFTPANHILFHNYARHNAPRFWEHQNNKVAGLRNLGQARVKHFMKSYKNGTSELMVPAKWAAEKLVDREEELYGLGKQRGLEEYYRFADVNRTHWRVGYGVCDNITRGVGHTPFKYHARK